MMKQYSVAIVGLSKLFREGLQGILKRSRFNVVIHGTTLEEVLAVHAATPPELAICAIESGDAGDARIQELCKRPIECDRPLIVLLTDALAASQLRDVAAAGIRAVLSKDITSEVLQRSLELVMLGQQVFPGLPDEPPPRPSGSLIPFNRQPTKPSNSDQPQSDGGKPVQGVLQARLLTTHGAPRVSTLSERERQILACLVYGAANKTIARDLMITEATVKVHIKGLLRKIGVNNRTQAAVWGMTNPVSLGPQPVDEPETLLEPPMEFPALRHAAS